MLGTNRDVDYLFGSMAVAEQFEDRQLGRGFATACRTSYRAAIVTVRNPDRSTDRSAAGFRGHRLTPKLPFEGVSISF